MASSTGPGWYWVWINSHWRFHPPGIISSSKLPLPEPGSYWLLLAFLCLFHPPGVISFSSVASLPGPGLCLTVTIPSTRYHFFSSPGHFEQGQDYVEYFLPSLTIPFTRNHLFIVYGTKIMLVISGLPLTISSTMIQLFLLQHVFNRFIGLLGVAGLLLTIPSNRKHLCLLYDALN